MQGSTPRELLSPDSARSVEGDASWPPFSPRQQAIQIGDAERVALDVSHEDLAEAARLDRTLISMLERGRQRATLETAQALAEALGLTLCKLAVER